MTTTGRWRTGALSCLLAAALGSCAGPGTTPPPEAPEILVSAAASLRVALEEIAADYGGSVEGRVLLNTGSSSSLARQIVEGAPVDLFLSADAAQMDVVEGAGRLVPGSRVDLLSNRLALIAPGDSPLAVAKLEDLTSPAVRRLGMAEPSAVPAGVYARRLLESRRLWEGLRSKVVPGRSVETVLAATEAGHVDAAFVYLTDARRSDLVETLLVFDNDPTGDGADRIVYPAALIARSRAGGDGPARDFLEYLQGPGAGAVFARLGFVTLVESGTTD